MSPASREPSGASSPLGSWGVSRALAASTRGLRIATPPPPAATEGAQVWPVGGLATALDINKDCDILGPSRGDQVQGPPESTKRCLLQFGALSRRVVLVDQDDVGREVLAGPLIL